MRKAMRTRHLLGPVLLLTLAGCGGETKPVATPPPPATSESSTRFTLTISGKPIQIRVAITDLELAAGLMHTTGLPDGEGMIFVYRDTAGRGFWMANVPYDIDIGFFDSAGRLDEVRRMKANDTEVVHSRSEAVRYALEAPAGWFAAQGLAPGAQLDLAALAKAVESRGFRASDFVGTR